MLLSFSLTFRSTIHVLLDLHPRLTPVLCNVLHIRTEYSANVNAGDTMRICGVSHSFLDLKENQIPDAKQLLLHKETRFFPPTRCIVFLGNIVFTLKVSPEFCQCHANGMKYSDLPKFLFETQPHCFFIGRS